MNTLSKLSVLFVLTVAVLAAQPNTVTLTPYVVTGEGWGTSIIAHNFQDEPAVFTITYRLKDSIGVNQPFPSHQGHTYEQVYSLGPQGSVMIRSVDGPWLLAGYAEITAPAPNNLHFTAVYRRGEHLTTAYLRPAQKLMRTEFDSLSFQTAIAVVNASQDEQHVLARFYDESGALLRSWTIGMAPASTQTFDVGAYAGANLLNARGNLVITAPDGVSVLNLRFLPGGSFTSFPVQ